MQIELTGQHVEITDALRNYVNEKLQRLERHAHQVKAAHVVLKVEKIRHTAEATLPVEGNGGLFASATEPDMYAAIDALVDKLDRQVRKYKEKSTDHHVGDGSMAQLVND